MSAVENLSSSFTFLTAVSMRLSSVTGLRPARDALRMTRRMKSCWREIRPRSPVGSARQRPFSTYSYSRLRTYARDLFPSSSTQPGVLTLKPVILSRTGEGKKTVTPPTASTTPRKPLKSTWA